MQCNARQGLKTFIISTYCDVLLPGLETLPRKEEANILVERYENRLGLHAPVESVVLLQLFVRQKATPALYSEVTSNLFGSPVCVALVGALRLPGTGSLGLLNWLED